MKKTLKKVNQVGTTILLFVGIAWGISEINEKLQMNYFAPTVIAQVKQKEVQTANEDDKCCKICKKGKACRDGCINKQ
jgi:hypothetical protein